jgi:hypothetical protein
MSALRESALEIDDFYAKPFRRASLRWSLWRAYLMEAVIWASLDTVKSALVTLPFAKLGAGSHDGRPL